MPYFVLPFLKLDKNKVGIAGGKGANLGEMTKVKIPMPPGFVVLASAFEKFARETEIKVEIEAKMKKVHHKDINSVDRASNEIRALIKKAKMPKDISQEILENFKKLNTPYVAVRSSATCEDSKTASWAGELETFLFINKSNLLKAVKTCWSSLFTPRAIFYRFEKKLHKQKVSVAVVIQKMVNSEISGVAFTVHPVTKDKKQMIIEAVFGMGEAIVSGRITPDTYVVDKEDNYIVDINVSEQKQKIVKSKEGGSRIIKVDNKEGKRQKLSGRQIIELAEICKKIEKHYKHPQDIEWALEKNKFYIVQTRPITTL
jgi:pyruvate,water dikinase